MNDQNDNSKISDETGGEKRKKNKKGVLIFFGVLLVLMAVLVLLNNIDFDSLAEKASGRGKTSDDSIITDTAAVTIDPVFLAEPDYDEDITLDKEYMKENRCLHYTYVNETFEIIERSDAVDNVCRMFYDYFEAAKAGDSNAYYALFTENYVNSAGKSNFTPQKLYNIYVRCFRSERLTDGDANGKLKGYNVYYCDVSYNIKDNNGTLRNDFYGDDSTLPLVFEVIEKDDKVQISNIRRYVYSKGASEETESPFSPMFFVWLGIFVISAVLVIVLRRLYIVPHTAASFALIFLSFLIKSVFLQILIFAGITCVLIVFAAVIKKTRSSGTHKKTKK